MLSNNGTGWVAANFPPIFVLTFTDASEYGNDYTGVGVQRAGATNQPAEYFVPPSTISANQIGVYISRAVATPTDSLRCYIVDVTGGTTVTSGTLGNASVISTANQWIDIFVPTYTLNGGSPYRL